jgi:type IV pilus assembly protein PilQ
MIEARIVEADDSFNKNLGARLGYADYNRDAKGPVGINLPGSTRLGVTGNYLGVGEQTGQAAVTGGQLHAEYPVCRSTCGQNWHCVAR